MKAVSNKNFCWSCFFFLCLLVNYIYAGNNKAEESKTQSNSKTGTGNNKFAFTALKEENEATNKNRFISSTPDTAAITSLQASLTGSPRKLPLYGYNGNITKSPGWTNKAFRDSVASLDLKIIRYPGGSISDFWDWKTGNFVTTNENFERKEQFNDENNTPNTLDDLKLLVSETNCDVVFTLNMITSTLEDQLNMLAKAQSIGIPVRWIELGNEYNSRSSEGQKKFGTVTNYANACYQWTKAIKAKFPDVKIAVVGGNRNYSDEAKKWNSILQENTSSVDAIVAHVYPRVYDVVDNSGINFSSLYSAFQADFNRGGFNSLNSSWSIWITEYNVLWSAGQKNGSDNSQFVNYALTWSQALAVILMTSECTSLSNHTELILNHNIANSSSFSAIDTEGKTFKKMPNGIAMETWLKASDNMNTIQKVKLTESNSVVNDYEVLGWKFYNNTSASFLFANFTNKPININTSSLIKSNMDCTKKYAGKNDIVKGEVTIKKEVTKVKDLVTLPPYSIVTIR